MSRASIGGSASNLELAAAPQLLRRPRASAQDLLALVGSTPRCEDWEVAERAKRAVVGGGNGGGSARASPRGLPPLSARSWRRALSAALALALCLVLLFKHRSLYRNGQDAVAAAYYGLDPAMLGRSEARYPAPHCCRDEACAARGSGSGAASSSSSSGGGGGGGTGRVAVVTYLRDDAYTPLLQQLECTLRRSNPGLELGLMMVEGELGAGTLALARALNITLLPVAPLDYPNTYDWRYRRNWLKVRALGLVQYDAVLLVDADVAVTGALHPLFSMPVEFAAAWDQSKWLNRFRTVVQGINGGVFLLRPCAAVEAHMAALLEAHPKLRFTHSTAEQDFFGWYYRYTGATLPIQYNCQAEQALGADGLTVGGMVPKIVHFTRNKPFHGPQQGAPGHQYLCSLDDLHRRSILAGQMASPGLEAAEAAAAAAAAGAQPQGEQAAGQQHGGDDVQQQQQQQQQQEMVQAPAASGQARPDAQQAQQEQQQQEPDATHRLLSAQSGLLQQGRNELP